MQHEFKQGRLLLRRTPAERAPLVARLAKIEGQVRGVRQMIEEDRYCGDEIQQANAITAAVREVALMIVSQHLAEGLKAAASGSDQQEPLAEMLTLLRSAMKL